MKTQQSIAEPKISAHQIAQGPFYIVRRQIWEIITTQFGNMPHLPGFSDDLALLAVPVLQRVKRWGYYYQVCTLDARGGRSCELIHLKGGHSFLATGHSVEEAVLRACAMAVLHRWES